MYRKEATNDEMCGSTLATSAPVSKNLVQHTVAAGKLAHLPMSPSHPSRHRHKPLYSLQPPLHPPFKYLVQHTDAACKLAHTPVLSEPLIPDRHAGAKERRLDLQALTDLDQGVAEPESECWRQVRSIDWTSGKRKGQPGVSPR